MRIFGPGLTSEEVRFIPLGHDDLCLRLPRIKLRNLVLRLKPQVAHDILAHFVSFRRCVVRLAYGSDSLGRDLSVVVVVVVIKTALDRGIDCLHIGNIVAAKAIGVATARVVFTASHFDPFVERIVSLSRGSDSEPGPKVQDLSSLFRIFSARMCRDFSNSSKVWKSPGFSAHAHMRLHRVSNS